VGLGVMVAGGCSCEAELERWDCENNADPGTTPA
jgi:hypothetical protein